MYPIQWLELAQEDRQRIADSLGIKRSGVSQVVAGHAGGKIVSDGFTPEDLKVITVEKLQELTGSKKKDIMELANLYAKSLIK